MAFGLHLKVARPDSKSGKVMATKLPGFPEFLCVEVPEDLIVESDNRSRTYLLYCSVCQTVLKRVPFYEEYDDVEEVTKKITEIIERHACFRRFGVDDTGKLVRVIRTD